MKDIDGASGSAFSWRGSDIEPHHSVPMFAVPTCSNLHFTRANQLHGSASPFTFSHHPRRSRLIRRYI